MPNLLWTFDEQCEMEYGTNYTSKKWYDGHYTYDALDTEYRQANQYTDLKCKELKCQHLKENSAKKKKSKNDDKFVSEKVIVPLDGTICGSNRVK
jgi:hypothetical protein